MRVLVACEYSGRVRDAFASMGHDAWSCDLLETEMPGQHIVGDALEVAYSGGWDLMVAHPPCTYLTNSANVWLYNKDGSKNEERWEQLAEGTSFFKALYEAPIPKKCIENPIQSCHARNAHGCGKATQYVQPWMFGHKLVETNNVKE